MISDHRCFFCFSRAFEKLLEKENIPNEKKDSFTAEMLKLYIAENENTSSPEFARKLHNLLKSYTQNTDPYKDVKKENNDHAMSLIPELDGMIRASGNPFDTALRLSLAGNIIDFAASDSFNINSTISRALVSELAIDDSIILRERLAKAKSVLYLGDNAGEIVFDKLFINIIKHPNLTYVVRGEPVINDATNHDAIYTGMHEVANVISNGYDAPSTIPDKSSKEFQKYFGEADLIISKGQGNLEGLLPLRDERIFFLLIVKCSVISELLNVPKESFVVLRNCI